MCFVKNHHGSDFMIIEKTGSMRNYTKYLFHSCTMFLSKSGFIVRRRAVLARDDIRPVGNQSEAISENGTIPVQIIAVYR